MDSSIDASDEEISDVESIKEVEEEDEDKVSEGSEAEEEALEEDPTEKKTDEKDEAHSARLARTIFIGNLKANLELKVVVFVENVCLSLNLLLFLKLGVEKNIEAIWKCGFNSHSICCTCKEHTLKEGGISFVSYNVHTIINFK